MPRTTDRFPGPRIEEELQLLDRTGDGAPSVEGAVRYADGAFQLRDATGSYDPRALVAAASFDNLMVNSVTGALYTSSVDGALYLLVSGS